MRFPIPARLAALLALALLLAPPAAAQEDASDGPEGPSPIFTAHEPIEFTIEADFDELEDDRDQESEERPATLRFTNADGEEATLDLQVRTRGNFRLKKRTCSFPNLRLNFKKKQVEGTMFDGLDKVKLVCHCRDRDDYEQNVLEEYLIYRMYNLVTDVSFRVRPARITYVDVNGEKDTVTRYGFLIEDDEALAARHGGMVLDVPQVHPFNLDDEASVRYSLFQYMIGNTDWSMVQFHNTKLVRTGDGKHVPVPYDFDWAGAVDAPYAAPDPSLGTREVTDRIYRGFCRQGVDMKPHYRFFLENKEEFLDLYRNQPGLEEDNREDAIRYLEEFFETIESERRARNYIEEACRRVSG